MATPDGRLARAFADLPLDWPVAVVKLADALADYIRTIESDFRDYQHEADFAEAAGLTREQIAEHYDHVSECQKFLAKLHGYEVDPWLNGTIKADADRKPKDR